MGKKNLTGLPKCQQILKLKIEQRTVANKLTVASIALGIITRKMFHFGFAFFVPFRIVTTAKKCHNWDLCGRFSDISRLLPSLFILREGKCSTLNMTFSCQFCKDPQEWRPKQFIVGL